jgi:CRP-like cAMP-binding protein
LSISIPTKNLAENSVIYTTITLSENSKYENMSLYKTSQSAPSLNAVKLFARRSFLPEQANSLWKIDHGFVQTFTYLEDGTTIALGVWSSGDMVGQALSKLNPYQIECLTPVTATIVPIDGWYQLTDVLLTHLQQAEELIVIRSHRKVEIMLVKLLIWLSKKFGSEVDQGRLIDMRLTHEDLANLIGSTRVTVTRILGDFEQQGLIDRLSLHRIVLKQEDIWYYEI